MLSLSPQTKQRLAARGFIENGLQSCILLPWLDKILTMYVVKWLIVPSHEMEA